jgi:nucleoside-triphosphatase THEP1
MKSFTNNNILLLTGEPGVGKTYILNNVLKSPLLNIEFRFITKEIRNENNNRIGFQLVSVNKNNIGEPTDIKWLAYRNHTNITDKDFGSLDNINDSLLTNPHIFGHWLVSIANIDYFVNTYMNIPEQWGIVVLNEIGPMQCLSEKFMSSVEKLFDDASNGKCAIIGTVKLNKSGNSISDDFIDNVKKFPEGNIITNTKDNRNNITNRIAKMVISLSR